MKPSGDILVRSVRCGVCTTTRMAKLGMGNVPFSMHRSHTEKAETRRRNGCAAEEQEESMDSEDGHDDDDVWFGTVRYAIMVMVSSLVALLALTFGIAVERENFELDLTH
jgi:hypothetical protein